MSFQATATHELTHTVAGPSDGEAGSRIKLGFNPTGHRPTDAIKTFMTCAMQAVIDERTACRAERAGWLDVGQAQRELAIANQERSFAMALSHIEEAAMDAVAALHAPKNAGMRQGD